MPRRRVFVPPECIRDGSAQLPPAQQHYLRDVLRLRPGEQIEVFDGEGGSWIGELGRRGNAAAAVGLVPCDSTDRAEPAVCLALALIKSDRFEWALEKAAELGASEVVPLETHFSPVRIPPHRLDSRLERWRRIVREASRQCGRVTAPAVRPPELLERFLQLPERADSIKLYFHEHEGDPWIEELPAGRDAVVLVGPEGGWHADETAMARRAGCRLVHLEGWTLRSETAALAALSVVRFAKRKSHAC